MLNNDIIRSLRYILNIEDQKLVDIVGLAEGVVSLANMRSMLKNEDEPTFLACDDKVMSYFLDGLIYFKRGKDESRPPLPFELPISNNIILKKLRVAFELKEDDIHSILESANCKLGRSELSAFMRKRDHPNYRDCGDQVMRYFLKGLKLKIRGT